MIDDRTPYLDLPLPHPDNLLSEDVLRLRQAVVSLDTGFQEQSEQVATALAQATAEVDGSLALVQADVNERLETIESLLFAAL